MTPQISSSLRPTLEPLRFVRMPHHRPTDGTIITIGIYTRLVSRDYKGNPLSRLGRLRELGSLL